MTEKSKKKDFTAPESAIAFFKPKAHPHYLKDEKAARLVCVWCRGALHTIRVPVKHDSTDPAFPPSGSIVETLFCPKCEVHAPDSEGGN